MCPGGSRRVQASVTAVTTLTAGTGGCRSGTGGAGGLGRQGELRPAPLLQFATELRAFAQLGWSNYEQRFFADGLRWLASAFLRSVGEARPE
jgi:hypothetical protein